jgi:predicted TIM-barrel fold metal-dependent hydrolase
VIIDAHHHLWTADHAWLQDPALGRIRRDYTVAAAGLVNELVVRASQLPSVARAAEALPHSTFVLDHLGKPEIAAGGFGRRRDLIAPVAACPNVTAKLSGLVSEANWATWTPDDLKPYVDIAVDVFAGTAISTYHLELT